MTIETKLEAMIDICKNLYGKYTTNEYPRNTLLFEEQKIIYTAYKMAKDGELGEYSENIFKKMEKSIYFDVGGALQVSDVHINEPQYAALTVASLLEEQFKKPKSA